MIITAGKINYDRWYTSDISLPVPSFLNLLMLDEWVSSLPDARGVKSTERNDVTDVFAAPIPKKESTCFLSAQVFGNSHTDHPLSVNVSTLVRTSLPL